jgi:hypothetical protein
MSNYKGDLDPSQGNPSLTAVQALQNVLGANAATFVGSLERVSKTVVSGSAGVEADIPMGAEIIGVTVICKKANSSGTMTVKTGADTPVDITDAIACETDKAVDYAATIDDAYNIVGADGVKIFGNGAADYGVVYIKYLK